MLSKKMFSFVSFLLIFVFASCSKINETIEKQNKEMQMLSEKIDNQAALIYEIVGKNIPVITPEDSKSKLNVLNNEVNSLYSEFSEEKLENVKKLYIDFINTTSPWIQENESKNILNIKYTIDFCSIINDDELDESGQIESLYAFIENNGNYEKIDEVVDKYNSLIEKRTKEYNDKINTLNKNIEEKINESINRDTLDTLYNDLSDLYDEANPYSLDENLSDNFKKLQVRVEEINFINELKRELDALNNFILADEIKSPINYNEYSQKLLILSMEIEKLNSLDKQLLNNIKKDVVSNLEKYSKDLMLVSEQDILDDAKESLEICEEQINGLKKDIVSASAIQLLATQLASIDFNISTLKLIDDSILMPVKDKIKSCILKINAKEAEISQAINNKNNDDIKEYNRKVLNKINSIRVARKSNKNFLNKNSGVVAYLLDLEKIQVNYLYLPINNLYQELYQELWGKIDSDSRVYVSQKSIDEPKWGLGDDF